MSETKNYKLHLTDDSTEKFRDWRDKMNGPEDSNMEKIDTALGEKADRSTTVSAILYGNAWVGVTPPFTQTISIDGLGALQNGNISVAQSATITERELAREALLSVVGQEDGKLMIAADGEMPEFDIPVSIILLG